MRYTKANLPQPFSQDYQNNFEKELFMAINMLRHNPKSFIPHVQRIFAKDLCKGSKSMSAVIARLKEVNPMSVVKFDDDANAACRGNNEDIKARAEDAPAAGGNVDKLQSVAGASREAKAREASFFNYNGANAEELISILLVKDFDARAEADKKKKEEGEE